MMKYTSIKYTSSKYDAALMINDCRFKDLTSLDSNLWEVNLARRRLSINIPTYLGHHILCLSKRTLLAFYYDYINKYWDPTKYNLLQCDTDSLYLKLSEKNVDNLVRDDMKEKYFFHVYGSCFKINKKDENGVSKLVPNLELEIKPSIDYLDVKDSSLIGKKVFGDYYLLRRCCPEHFKFDSRTSSLFKEELSLDSDDGIMISLNSKCYICNSNDAGILKISCKGISDRFLKNPLDIYKAVLETRQSQPAENRGFLFKDRVMRTYNMFRSGFQFFYIKRQVHEDLCTTSCLDIVLTPYKRDDELDEKSKKK